MGDGNLRLRSFGREQLVLTLRGEREAAQHLLHRFALVHEEKRSATISP